MSVAGLSGLAVALSIAFFGLSRSGMIVCVAEAETEALTYSDEPYSANP